jgi:hypothetical protein
VKGAALVTLNGNAFLSQIQVKKDVLPRIEQEYQLEILPKGVDHPQRGSGNQFKTLQNDGGPQWTEQGYPLLIPMKGVDHQPTGLGNQCKTRQNGNGFQWNETYNIWMIQPIDEDHLLIGQGYQLQTQLKDADLQLKGCANLFKILVNEDGRRLDLEQMMGRKGKECRKNDPDHLLSTSQKIAVERLKTSQMMEILGTQAL